MNCFAQDSIPATTNGLNKNILYGSTGIFMYIFGASANVERIIYYKESAFIKYCLTKISFGSWADLWDSGSHFESHIGLAVIYNKSDYDSGVIYEEDYYKNKLTKSDYIEYHPSVAFGYRYQKSGGIFVFRTGVGFPEYIYVSFGISF